MRLITHRFARASLIAIGVAAAASVGAQHSQAQRKSKPRAEATARTKISYVVTNLTSDLPNVAANTDRAAKFMGCGVRAGRRNLDLRQRQRVCDARRWHRRALG
jgi:hypothetical protein